MKIAQLRAFVSVVDHGSFSDAARMLGVSQPSVTMQLQALEAELGATLLDRRYRRVDLTDEGRALLPHARRVLEEVERARDDVAELSETVSGRLTIAASSTPGSYVIPALLGSFVEAYPQIGVSVISGDSTTVAEAVEAGDAHFGLAGAMLKGAHVRYEAVGDDDLILISAPGADVAKRSGVTLSDLCDEPWVFREPGSGTRQVTETLFAEHGVDPEELRVLVELGTGEAVVSAVEGGLGLAIVSRMVAERSLELATVVEVPAVGFPRHRPLFAVLPTTSMSRAGDAFWQHVRNALAH